jgi:hypothetical protein
MLSPPGQPFAGQTVYVPPPTFTKAVIRGTTISFRVTEEYRVEYAAGKNAIAATERVDTEIVNTMILVCMQYMWPEVQQRIQLAKAGDDRAYRPTSEWQSPEQAPQSP